MDFNWKKMLAIAGVVLGPVILTFILLSNPMMDTYHKWVKEDPKNEKSTMIDHQWLLLAIADTCYKTMREEKSAQYYYDYMVLYPKDTANRPHVLLRYGHALNEDNQNKLAIQVYTQFIEEYENDPAQKENVESAKQGIIHINYFKP